MAIEARALKFLVTEEKGEVSVFVMERVQVDTQGRVISLFMKTEKGLPLARPSDRKLLLHTRFGIEGDANAGGVGPRQVLLVAMETLQAFKLQPGDLRENVVVAGVPLDDLPSGSVLQLGDSATVRLTFHCEVCKYIGTLGVKPIQSLENKRGFLAVVLKGSVVCEGDPVRVLDKCYDSVPDRTSDRFLWVVKQIPFGKVMTYKQVVDVLGGVAFVLPRVAHVYEARGGTGVSPASHSGFKRVFDAACG